MLMSMMSAPDTSWAMAAASSMHTGSLPKIWAAAGVLPPPAGAEEWTFILKAQGLGADHLGTGQPRPLLPADGTERQVCHPAIGASASGTWILIPPISTMGTSWK